jgi:hypothetical protein
MRPAGIKWRSSVSEKICPGVVQPVVCDIQLNQEVYVDGETVIADVFRAANPSLGASPMSIEVRTWFELPDMAPPMGDLNLGADGSIVLAPGFDTDFGPRNLFTVTSAMARGDYQFGCRFLDPVTGRQKTLDLNPFVIE